MTTPAVRLEQLTSLRFFAALAVLASHLWPLAEEPNPIQPLARTLLHEGYVGVSFFFMLSGYILAHTYQRRLAEGRISRRRYLALRVARVWPLHALVAAPFAVVALVAGGMATMPLMAANLALLHSWVPSSTWYFSLNQPSWSLSDELFFYTAFAFVAGWGVRRLGLALALLLLLDGAMVFWRVAGGHGAVLDGDTPTLTHWLTYIAPPVRLVDFLIGMLLYRLPRSEARGGRIGKELAGVLEVGGLLVLAGEMIALPVLRVADAWRMQLAYLPVMALIIWLFGQGRGAVSRYLARSRALVLLGDASFGLYLIHLPIVHAAIGLQDQREEPWPWLPWAGLVVLVCVLASLVVYRWVEQPLLKRSRRLVDRLLPA